MPENDLQARVGDCLRMAAGHPAWWAAAFLTTLVVDRPLQFIFASQFLTGQRDVYPNILDLTGTRHSLLPLFLVAAGLVYLAGKALDYLGQAALIELADGERARENKRLGWSLRRGWRHLPRFALTVFPVELARYVLLLLPGFMWMAWRRFDPDFDRWCAYIIYNLAWLATCMPLAVGLGVFSELAGREVVLGASRPPEAWREAWSLGWRNRQAVLAAWVPTFIADVVTAAFFLAISFPVAYAVFLIGHGDGVAGVARDLASALLYALAFVAAKTVHVVAQSFKSALWTLTFRKLESSVLN